MEKSLMKEKSRNAESNNKIFWSLTLFIKWKSANIFMKDEYSAVHFSAKITTTVDHYMKWFDVIHTSFILKIKYVLHSSPDNHDTENDQQQSWQQNVEETVEDQHVDSNIDPRVSDITKILRIKQEKSQ